MGQGGDGEGWGYNLAPSSPHCLCGAGKTRAGQSGERRVKRGEEKLPSLVRNQICEKAVQLYYYTTILIPIITICQFV